MNYPIIRDFELDINQAFDVNKVPEESYSLDLTQNIFVPRFAPFFMNSLTLWDKKGQELVKGQDYRIYKMMGELSTLTAKPVACLIEILNTNIKDVTYTYHSVGSSPLFDRSLIEIINNAANDQRMIKWKNIKNKPIVFDPILHTHLLPFDIVMFQDMINMFDAWTDNLEKIDPNLGVVGVTTQVNLIRNYVDRNTAIVVRAIQVHAETPDAHTLTKDNIGLDKVANVGTATLAESLRGLPNLRITAKNLNEMITRFGYNGSAYLKANTLPITYFGEGEKGNVTTSGTWNIVFTNPGVVVFNGKNFVLPAGVIDLRTVKALPGSTTFYLYVRLKDGFPEYNIDTIKRFNTSFNVWVGTIITNATAVASIVTFNKMLLNGTGISEKKSGGTIPAVTGDITGEGQMAWIRAPEVIQQ